MGNNPGFTCSTSRVWITFATRPTMPVYQQEHVHMLAKKRPSWLYATLQGIGLVHWRMVQLNKLDANTYDEESFVALAREGVEIDSALHYLCCKRDMPRRWRAENTAMIKHSDRFANTVLSTVVQHGNESALSDADMPVHVKYARVCVTLAERLVRETPNCARIFDGSCVGDGVGTTPERRTLEKALKSNGVRILQWCEEVPDNVLPLVFPPSFITPHKQRLCMLVEIEGR